MDIQSTAEGKLTIASGDYELFIPLNFIPTDVELTVHTNDTSHCGFTAHENNSVDWTATSQNGFILMAYIDSSSADIRWKAWRIDSVDPFLSVPKPSFHKLFSNVPIKSPNLDEECLNIVS